MLRQGILTALLTKHKGKDESVDEGKNAARERSARPAVAPNAQLVGALRQRRNRQPANVLHPSADRRG